MAEALSCMINWVMAGGGAWLYKFSSCKRALISAILAGLPHRKVYESTR